MKHVIVQISPHKYIIAESVSPDTILIEKYYKACTKSLFRHDAFQVCYELNNVDCQNWSKVTENSLLEKEL